MRRDNRRYDLLGNRELINVHVREADGCPPEKLHPIRYIRNSNGLRQLRDPVITERRTAERQAESVGR